jgi:hypothetical protein
MKDLRRFVTVFVLLFVVTSCKEDEAGISFELPSITVSAPGLGIVDGAIPVTVVENATDITIDYTITTSSTIQQLVLTIDGTEESIADAIGKESYTGQHVLSVPYENSAISIQFNVSDVNELAATESIIIQVSAGGAFIVEGDIQVTGNVRQGEEIVITGVGFGNGPNVILYDDFEGGAHEDLIPLTSPLIGEWAAMSTTYKPRYHEYSYSGSTSFSMQDDLAPTAIYGKKDAQLKARFDDTQEVFISYQLAVPPGKHFPGAPTREEWGAASHWKITWLMDGDNGFGGNDGKADLCIPTNGRWIQPRGCLGSRRPGCA